LIEEFMLAANRAVAGYLSGAGSNLCTACTRNRTRAKSWNSKSWRARLAIHSASKIASAEITVGHGRVPAPAKAGRPDTYGQPERGMKVALPV